MSNEQFMVHFVGTPAVDLACGFVASLVWPLGRWRVYVLPLLWLTIAFSTARWVSEVMFAEPMYLPGTWLELARHLATGVSLWLGWLAAQAMREQAGRSGWRA